MAGVSSTLGRTVLISGARTPPKQKLPKLNLPTTPHSMREFLVFNRAKLKRKYKRHPHE